MQKNVTKAKGALGKQGFYKLPDHRPGLKSTDDRIVEGLALLYSAFKDDKSYGILNVHIKDGFIMADSQVNEGKDRLHATYVSPEKDDWDDWDIDPEDVTEVEQ